MVVFHHLPHDLFPAYQHHKRFCAGEGGVEEIAGKQHRRAAHHGHDDHRKFAALALVNAQTVGQIEVFQLGCFVNGFLILVKEYRQGLIHLYM